jgi:hypothetical protein
LISAGEIREAGNRASQGRPPVRPPGHGQDPVRACRGQPHGRVLHPRDRLRAGAEVRGRGGPHGARAVRDGALQEGLSDLFRRDRRHRRGALRRRRRRRQRGAAHHAGADQPAGRVRPPRQHQGADGDQSARHSRPRPDAARPPRQEGGVRAARPGGAHSHLQDPRAVHERRARHQVRTAGEAVPQLDGRGDPQRVHRGGHVCHQGQEESGHGEGLPGGGQQSYQVVCQVLGHSKIHDL